MSRECYLHVFVILISQGLFGRIHVCDQDGGGTRYEHEAACVCGLGIALCKPVISPRFCLLASFPANLTEGNTVWMNVFELESPTSAFNVAHLSKHLSQEQPQGWQQHAVVSLGQPL